MIEKLQKIKKSRINKDDLKIMNLLEKIEFKKCKNKIYLINDFKIYCEIDLTSEIIWVDYYLFSNNVGNYVNWKNVVNNINKFFNINLDNYNTFSFKPTYTKKYFYLGKPRKMNILYGIICLFNYFYLSLSRN